LKIINYNDKSIFEHRFWLQILGDHSRFIYNALSPKQNEEIKYAQYFIERFDKLLAKAHKSLSDNEVDELNIQAQEATSELKKFKLNLLKCKLVDKIEISLPPTFIDHMLNELDEYILVLSFLVKKQLPELHPLHYHLLWLSDGSGHAASLSSNLDMDEKKLIKTSKEFEKIFQYLFVKAIDFNGYTRTGLFDFPALSKLDFDADMEMNRFKEYLLDIQEGVIQNKILGTISPLMPDHMYREGCYYLTKLSEVSNTKTPQCDPTKPHVNV
jgi:hypothetical protein